MCVYGLVFNIRKRRARSAQSVLIESRGLSGKEGGTKHQNSAQPARRPVIDSGRIEVAEASVVARRATRAEQSLIRSDRQTSSKRVHGRR